MKKVIGIISAVAVVAVIALSGCQQGGQKEGTQQAPGSAPTQTSPSAPAAPGPGAK